MGRRPVTGIKCEQQSVSDDADGVRSVPFGEAVNQTPFDELGDEVRPPGVEVADELTDVGCYSRRCRRDQRRPDPIGVGLN